MTRHTPRTAAAAVLLLGLAGPGICAESPAAAREPDALRGPSVTDDPLGGAKGAAAAPSLVDRDFDGRIKRLDTDPVRAALERLELDADASAAAQDVLLKRTVLLDRLVEENIEEIVRLANARQAGDDQGARESLRILLDRARPLAAGGRPVGEVAKALPPEQAEALRRMVREYWDALIDERVEDLAGKSATDRERRRVRVKAAATEITLGFGQEVKRSYERVFGQRVQDFEALLKSLNLTPEQHGKIRGMVTDLFQKAAGRPTESQKAAVFLRAWALLTPEQRDILREKMGGKERRRGAQDGSAAPGVSG